ncbi:MAG: ABC transporter permease, partial [Betaproteobacteria bacterium]
MIRNTALMFAHALRMTRRDWRAGELRFLLVALVIAVAASSAVGFFVDRMNRALSRDAAQLLGGDLLIRSDYPLNQAWRDEAARRELLLADTVTFPSMATSGDGNQTDTRLVAVKAVSGTYPLRGALQLQRGAMTETARGAPVSGEVWVD